MSAAVASPLVSLNIPAPTDPELTGASGALQSARGYVVEDQESYEFAGKEVVRIAGIVKLLDEKRLGITRPLDKAKAAVMDLFRGPVAAYEQARSEIQSKMLAYRSEEDRKARALAAEQRRLAEEEDRQRRDEAAARAAEAEKAGNVAAAEEARAEVVAPPIPLPVLIPAAPKAAGTSVRKVWKAEGIDIAATIAAAAAGDVLAIGALQFNDKFIGQQARSLEAQCKIPGVRVWPEDTMAARG